MGKVAEGAGNLEKQVEEMEASKKSVLSFDHISADIVTISSLIQELSGAVASIHRETDAVSAGMGALEESVRAVNTAAEEMKTGSVPVFSCVRDLAKNAAAIMECSRSSIGRTMEIQRNAGRVREISARNGEDVQELAHIVGKIKI